MNGCQEQNVYYLFVMLFSRSPTIKKERKRQKYFVKKRTMKKRLKKNQKEIPFMKREDKKRLKENKNSKQNNKKITLIFFDLFQKRNKRKTQYKSKNIFSNF